MMAATTDQSTPDELSTPVLQKRKLSELDDLPKINGTSDEASKPGAIQHPNSKDGVKAFLDELIPIMQIHDTIPSILNRAMGTELSSPEPSPKRKKVSDEQIPATIARKIADEQYRSLAEFQEDVRRNCDSVLKSLHDKEKEYASDPEKRFAGRTEEEVHLYAGVLTFKKVLSNLVDAHVSKEADMAVPSPVAGNRAIENLSTGSVTTGSVLSIFANAQGPKQLFSSFQQPYRTAKEEVESIEAGLDVTLPVRESALPNFIMLTRRPHIPLDGEKGSSRKPPKFADLFAPPSDKVAPALQMPKTSSLSTKLLTKTNDVTWVPKDKILKPTSSRYNWATMKQSTGRWVSYSVPDPNQDIKSPDVKRRYRDRAMSIANPNPPRSEEARKAEDQAKVDALFRSIYSSFAPSIDNTCVLVSEATRNDLWWERVGKNRAERVFVDAPLKCDLDEDGQGDETQPDFSDEELDRIAVNFDPISDKDIDPAILGNAASIEDGEEALDVDERLSQTSKLIDTLYSYQKLRLSQLTSSTAPITPVGTRSILLEMLGTPSAPSISETEAQNKLKCHLAELVMQLPPQVVTRVDGQKDTAMSFSSRLQLQFEDNHGIMEEERPISQNKAANHGTSQTPAQVQNRGPVSAAYSGYGMLSNQHGRQQAATPLSNRTPVNYYPQTQPASNRNPSISYPRTAGGVSGGAHNWSSGYSPANRQNAGSSGYSNSGPRAGYNSAGQYQQTPTQAPGQQRTQSYGNYYTQGTPQTGYNRQYAPSSYVSRTQPVAPAYGYPPQAVASPQFRTASPLQGMQTASATPGYNRPQSGQATRSQYYGPPQAAAIGPSGFHTSMSAHDQQKLMDRQRAQAQMAYQTNQARLSSALPANSNSTAGPAMQGVASPQHHSKTLQSPAITPSHVNGTPAA